MIIIGEKINGSIPSVAKAIEERNADWIRDLAKKQADAGSTYIDVCASVDEDIEVETLHWLIDQPEPGFYPRRSAVLQQAWSC